ncbi:MAG: PEP-CTERM sorting domain-containing protein [Isosphaeraceae bacterium]
MNSNTVFSSTSRQFGAVLLFLALAVGGARPAVAQYDPSTSFSPTSNPNGVWSYGFEEVPLGSPFTLLPVPIPVTSVPGPSIDSWQIAGFGTMGVFHNGTASTQLVATGTDNAMYDAGVLAMHPGPNDQFAMVQFSAPTPGFYTIQGVFQGIDTAMLSTGVYLLHDNVVVASGVVPSAYLAQVPLSSGPIFLNVGDTLTYAVGGGPFHDTTALINAEVSPASSIIPEPSSLVLLAIACVALAAWGWRRRACPA